MTALQINQSNNHPKSGEMIAAKPICSLVDIAEVKDILKYRPRDLAIFIIGINAGFRASDICKLKVGDVRGLKVGDEFTIRMQKTKGKITVTWNKACFAAVKSLLATMSGVNDEECLFQSRKGHGRLTVPTLSNLVKSWCEDIGLEGHYSSHTLRKTFGYIHRTVFKTDRDVICKLLGHKDYTSLDAYLGIQPEERKAAYLKDI